MTSRKQIIDIFLEKINNGYILTREDRLFLKDMSNEIS